MMSLIQHTYSKYSNYFKFMLAVASRFGATVDSNRLMAMFEATVS